MVIWDYKRTKAQLVSRTTETLKWEKLHENKMLTSNYIFLKKPMRNMFLNSISNKNIICIDKDPFWFNNQIKS